MLPNDFEEAKLVIEKCEERMDKNNLVRLEKNIDSLLVKYINKNEKD